MLGAAYGLAEGGDWVVAEVSKPIFGDGRGGGELLVFGKGNDEAAGRKSEGVAVRKRILTDEEMAQRKFWWERMELSQGMGVSGQHRE